MTYFKNGIIFGAGYVLGSTILNITLTPLVTVANMKMHEFIIDKFVE